MTQLTTKLTALGVPSWQAEGLQTHIEEAEHYVYSQDPADTDAALAWIAGSLSNHLDTQAAALLYNVICQNKPQSAIQYTEKGYDSCQSHRQLSKVASEAILLGGLIHESSLLGAPIRLFEAQAMIGSALTFDSTVEEAIGLTLANVAMVHGHQQDFLFPGITPSNGTVPSLGHLAYQALIGQPITSVRTLTGVGGLRHDENWNYAMDLPSFVNEKIVEDKRYYPGMGIFYTLMTQSIDNFPAVTRLKQSQTEVYAALTQFATAIQRTQPKQFNGVTVLCSAYLPSWSELKSMQGLTVDQHIELAESFHSPSYDFSVLHDIFTQINVGKPIDGSLLAQLNSLQNKLHHAWSFNSTIHLPWTSELAGLSNNYIGRITNLVGDYGERYGIGHQGKSMEVREYHFGLNRTAPADLNGRHAYEVRIYPSNDHFADDYQRFTLYPDHTLWKAIKQSGFLRAALEHLQEVTYE